MAKRIVYFGAFNNHKKEELIEKSIKRLKRNEGHKFYYLLPNGELLTKYRRDFINAVEQTFEINLYTFDNIVKNILEDEVYIDINEAIKDIIIKEVIKELDLKGEITYYKDFLPMEGFAKSLNGIIGEIKRSLVYPKDYLKECPNQAYYKEIGLIYKAYEAYLKEHNLIDREGAYFKAIEILSLNENYFKGLDFIIIDEFYDFRPIEIAILKELCKSDVDIYINIPFKMKSNPPNISETINILQDLGFNLESIEKEEETFFENMGKSLFSHGEEKLEGNKNLSLIKAPSIYLELKKIFEEIKKDYKNGLELKEIAIVLLSEDYKDILFEVAKEERVPISLTKDKPLGEVPLVKEFLNIIKVKIKELDKQSIINRMKSYYFQITDYDYKNGLEFILRKLNFNHIDGLIDLIENEKRLNITMDYIGPIKDITEKILNEIGKIKDQDSIGNYNNIFMEIIDEYNLEEEIYERYRVGKDYDLLHRDLSALGKLKETINSLDEVTDLVEEIKIEDYFQVLSILLGEETIGEIDENINGVKILNPINSRGFKHESLFITGLSQEHYPKLKVNNFFINDENYSTLKNLGLDVKDYYERLNNEGVKFASLLSSCNGKLYLSFSEGVEGDDISSIFLDEILNMLKGERLGDKVNLIDIDLGYLVKEDIETITTEEELSNFLLLNQGEELSDDLRDYFGIHNNIHGERLEKINKKIWSEYKRNEEGFNEYSGFIGEEKIIEDIKEKNKKRVYSNTFLETYAKCPYSFLLSRLLKVEEMERFFQEYSPMDIGNIYHEVLNHYYKTYKEDIRDHVKGIGFFEIEDTLEFIKELVHRYGGEFGLDPNNKSNLLILENTEDRIKEFIYADIERISGKKEKLLPHSFEVDFGREEEFFIEVDGEKIRLKGTIDRIDKFLDEDKYIIMDYKSSDYGIYSLDKIEEGLSLQLPIYTMSQEDKKVVVGLYGILKNSKFQMTIGIKEETKIVTGRHGGALTGEEWNSLMETTKKNIKDIKDNILQGDFSVNPLECSDYCIYKDICRYENRLEVED